MSDIAQIETQIKTAMSADDILDLGWPTPHQLWARKAVRQLQFGFEVSLASLILLLFI